MAADEHLPGFFGGGAPAALRHGVKRPADIVIPAQVLHQILRHGGQGVGVLNVFVIIISVAEGNFVVAGVQHNARFIQNDLADHALVQPGGAAFGRHLGGTVTHFQRHALGVELFRAALPDFQQDVAHHTAFQQGTDALTGAHFLCFILNG